VREIGEEGEERRCMQRLCLVGQRAMKMRGCKFIPQYSAGAVMPTILAMYRGGSRYRRK